MSRRRSTTASTTSTSRRATGTPRTCSGRPWSRYRKNVFLTARPPSAAPPARGKSSKARCARCGRDHFDLYQLHAVTTPDDVEKIFAPSGALETFLAARKEGQSPLPRLLRPLRRGGNRPHSPPRLRHDPLPGQLRHVARGELRRAGAGGGAGEEDGHPGVEGDGEGPVARRAHSATRTRSAGTSRCRSRQTRRWACGSRSRTR